MAPVRKVGYTSASDGPKDLVLKKETDLSLDSLERVVDRLGVTFQLLAHLSIGHPLEIASQDATLEIAKYVPGHLMQVLRELPRKNHDLGILDRLIGQDVEQRAVGSLSGQ